jgi:HD-GYP domain-containing protein (c-di-GMP phosphodiesterase class II)
VKDRRDGRISASPVDERRRQLGLQMVVRFLAVLRTGKAYQVGNQVFRAQLDALFEVIAPLLDEFGEVVLVSLESDLYLNGVRLPMKSANLRHFDALMREFSRRRIAGIRVVQGVQPDELESFFGLFLRPHEYTGTPLLEACVAAGLDHVLPAVHASTEGGEAGEFEVDDAADSGTGTGGFGTGAEGDPGPNDPEDPTTSMRGGAQKNYAVAMHGARSLLTTTTLQEGTELRHAKRVVQPLVDGAFSSEPVVVGLTSLGHHDEYTYAHAVNVCMVAVTIGHTFGLDRRALADLGVAALLHDVGKAAVGTQIQHPLEAFTPEDQALAERHPAEGARLIARSTVLNATTMRCMRVALEHHLTSDGKGYPKGESIARASLLSRLVSVADCYVSLMTHRSEQGRNVTPYEALGLMLGPLNRKFYPALLWALVKAVGYFPPGQLVELDNGFIALVLAPNADDFFRPHVRIVVRSDGSYASGETPVEYRPLPQERRVVRALKASEYPSFEPAKRDIAEFEGQAGPAQDPPAAAA